MPEGGGKGSEADDAELMSSIQRLLLAAQTRNERERRLPLDDASNAHPRAPRAERRGVGDSADSGGEGASARPLSGDKGSRPRGRADGLRSSLQHASGPGSPPGAKPIAKTARAQSVGAAAASSLQHASGPGSPPGAKPIAKTARAQSVGAAAAAAHGTHTREAGRSITGEDEELASAAEVEALKAQIRRIQQHHEVEMREAHQMVVQAQGQQAQPAGSRTPSSAVMIPRGTGRPGGGVAPPPWGYGGGVRSKSVGAVGTTGRLLVAPSETRSPTFIQQQWMGAELGVPKTPASACSAGKIALAASPAATERGSWEQPRHTSSSPPVDARASADAAAIAAQGAAAAAVKIWQMTYALSSPSTPLSPSAQRTELRASPGSLNAQGWASASPAGLVEQGLPQHASAEGGESGTVSPLPDAPQAGAPAEGTPQTRAAVEATGGTADTTVDTPVLAKGRRVTLGAGAGGGPGLALPVPVFVQEGRTGGSPGGGGDECNEEFVARGGEKAVVVYSEPGCAGGEEGDAAVVAGAAGAEKAVRKMRQLMMPHAVASKVLPRSQPPPGEAASGCVMTHLDARSCD